MQSKEYGFTLIEVMIVVVIVGIITSVALPSYTQHVRSTRRTDAHTALLRIQQAQENWRVSNIAYTTDMTATGLNQRTTSENNYYALAVSGVSATGYTLTATAQGAQASDTTCAAITLVVAGATPLLGPSVTQGPAGCWK